MAYDLQEQESIDELKAWWDKWGNLTLGAITVVCLAFAGYNGMKWYDRYKASEANKAYASLQTAIGQQAEPSSVSKIVDALLKDGSSTVYAPMGALTASKYFETKADPAKAQSLLNWVINESDHPEYRVVASVRLAGFLMDEQKYDEVIKLLTAVNPSDSELLLVNDRLGDAYFAKGDIENARKVWQQALAHPVDQALTGFVQLKLQALPEAQKVVASDNKQ